MRCAIFQPPSAAPLSPHCWLRVLRWKVGGFLGWAAAAGVGKMSPAWRNTGERTVTTALLHSQPSLTHRAPRHDYRSWRLKFSRLRVLIASSFAYVASDGLGPAAEAYRLLLTLFQTHVKTHAGLCYVHTHTQDLCTVVWGLESDRSV